MDDNNKPVSEFEKLVKEATGEIPTIPEKKVEVKPAADNNENQTDKKEDIQIVDEPKVELPQTKEDSGSTIPTNINTSQDEATTIGTIKPDKQKSPITMMVLFGLLILFIIFMPTVLSLFNKYFGTNLSVNPISNTQTKEEVVKEEKQNTTMYPLNSDTIISLDKLEIGGFTKNNTDGYKLSFYIKNTGSVLYSFQKKLYLEYYDNNNTFVGRSYLQSVKEITGGITNNYTIDIDSNAYDNATKVEIIQRTEDDYPSISLENNQLTCNNNTDNIVYTFDTSSKLTNIRHMYTYTKGSDLITYNNDLINYKTKISNLDYQDGVTAVLTETDTGFITTIAIDYQSADYSKLSSNLDYYDKNTSARIISFEMNAKGYTCR